MEYVCGEAPGGNSNAGSPTPSITIATKLWIGAISATTFGVSAAAAPPHPKATATLIQLTL